MEEIQFSTCEVCTFEYDDESMVPLVLSCGHSFCKRCLEKIIEKSKEKEEEEDEEYEGEDENQYENEQELLQEYEREQERRKPKCPKCRTPITTPISSISRNYSLLQTINTYKSRENTRNKRKILEDMLDSQSCEISQRISQFNHCFQQNRANAKLLKRLKENSHDENELRKIWEKIRKDYKEANKILWNSKGIYVIDLKNFNKTDEFLQGICCRIESGDDLYGFHQIHNVLKYGKISLRENIFFFHSLDLCGGPSKNSYLIQLNDLKKCFDNKNLHIFMQIKGKDESVTLILIQILSVEKTSKFINLCSGELGKSYKGCHVDVEMVDFENFNEKYIFLNILSCENIVKNKRMNEAFDGGAARNSLPNELYFEKVIERFCFICNGSESLVDEALGKLIIPSDFQELLKTKEISKGRIFDCGIALKIRL
ncbi:UNVERIFIED_CONTAM: hypothetical protein RMT77_010896 [Armadillidium vulgare]